MIPDWCTNKVYFSALLEKEYPIDHANIIHALQELNIQANYLTDTKDIWARDYMPVQISDNRFVEYRYDPDYLQGKRKGYRDLKSYPDIVCCRNNLPATQKSDLILDGGNVVRSSNCIISTDKIAVENRLTKTETINQIRETFKVETVILLPWYKKEKYGHSDGVIRFINEDTVLLNEIDKRNSKLIKRLTEYGLEIMWLEFKVTHKNKLNWAYLNFLQIDNALLVPKLGIDEDEQAFQQIKYLFKGYIEERRIVQVNIRDIVEFGGGALNCISWTIKESTRAN